MKIGVPRETAAGERRVALVPEVVAKLAESGHQVVVEGGAGSAASFADGAYEAALKKWGVEQGAITDFAVNP